MAFAQITYRESLRDIEACLGSQPSKLGSFEQFMGQNDRLFPPSSVVRKVRMDI